MRVIPVITQFAHQSSTYFVRICNSIHHKWSEKGSLWQTLLCLFSLSGRHLFDKVRFFFQPQQEWKVQILDFPMGLGPYDSSLLPTSTSRPVAEGTSVSSVVNCWDSVMWRRITVDIILPDLRIGIYSKNPLLSSTTLCTDHYGMSVQVLLPGVMIIFFFFQLRECKYVVRFLDIPCVLAQIKLDSG